VTDTPAQRPKPRTQYAAYLAATRHMENPPSYRDWLRTQQPKPKPKKEQTQ
jgi:hypothetical protein